MTIMHLTRGILWTVTAVIAIVGCKKNSVDPNAVSISGISPSTGPRNATITITGVNFSTTASDNQVFINGHFAVVTDATKTTLTVVVPPKAGTGNVEVKSNGKTAKGPVFTYQYNYYTVTTLAGSVSGYLDGKGANAQFYVISGLAVDKDGNLIAAEYAYNTIRKIQPDGTVTTISGNPNAPGGYRDGPASNALFHLPKHVVVDKSNNIYVADLDNHNIRKLQYTASGYIVSTLVGSTSGQSGFVDGKGTGARFNHPEGLAIDSVGNLYVFDVDNYAVRKITQNGAVVVTLAGTGADGYANGYGSTASFGLGGSLCVDKKGNYLLVANYWNYNIRKLTPLSTADETLVTTEMGATPGIAGHADGDFSSAKFYGAGDIAIDEARGHVFITETFNHCIRMADLQTRTVTTLAGDPSRKGGDDGDVNKASFDSPNSITVDKEGNLYIYDVGTRMIRRIAYE